VAKSVLVPALVQKTGRWRISIPPALSSSGRREQRFFKTKYEANLFATQTQYHRQTYGELLEGLTQHDLSECVRCLELLRPVNVGLLEAVTAFLDDRSRRTSSLSLGQVFDTYADKSGRSQGYMDSIRHLRANLGPLMLRPVVDVTTDDLAAAFFNLAPGTRNLRISRLRTVLAFAVRKGYVDRNAALSLDLVDLGREEVHVYSPTEIARLLNAAQEHEPSLTTFIAICAFAGLRPEREARHLDWSDIHLDDPQPQIVVRPELSKTRRHRFVDIRPNLAEWLRLDSNRIGRIVPFSDSTLIRKRRNVYHTAGVEVHADALRHTYCSAFLAAGGDVNSLLLQAGHSSPSVTFRHYHRAMSDGDSTAFWSIRPVSPDKG
jgi:integrase